MFTAIEEHGMYAAVGLSWIINHWSRYDKAGDPATRFSETDFYNYGKWVAIGSRIATTSFGLA